jgi:hypothetical protein
MTQQDGTQTPTGFVLLIDGQFSRAYQIKSTTTDPCNSMTYVLVPVQEPGKFRLDETSQKLQVIDHSSRTCLDFHRYRWELDVTNVDLTHQVLGQMRMAGNPDSVMTPQ